MYQNRQEGMRCSYGNEVVSFERLLGGLGFTRAQMERDYFGVERGGHSRTIEPEVGTPPPITPPVLTPPENNPKMKNWVWLVGLILLAIIVVLMLLGKGSSEISISDWFTFRKGDDQTEQPVQPVATKVTVIGSVKINNENAKAEEVERVYVKDQTLAKPVALSGNLFKLSSVKVPEDKIIEIALEVKGVKIPPSALFEVPKPDENNVVDLGEILLKVTYPKPSKGNAGKSLAPIFNIINNNIVEQNVNN
jgi:hypothetical protein